MMETPTEDPDSFQAVFDELAADLEAVGLETERVPGDETGGWLEAHPPEVDGEVQLLLGHADTVWPSGTVEERGPEVREGALYGPGALSERPTCASWSAPTRASRTTTSTSSRAAGSTAGGPRRAPSGPRTWRRCTRAACTWTASRPAGRTTPSTRRPAS